MKLKKNVKRLSELAIGDIVIGKASAISYIVTANYGNRVTAVRSADITNPDEWMVIRDSKSTNVEY